LMQAHCTVCHEHFSTVANFDIHGPRRAGCPHPSTQTRYVEDDEGQPALNIEAGVA
jgi:hypothetical protein